MPDRDDAPLPSTPPPPPRARWAFALVLAGLGVVALIWMRHTLLVAFIGICLATLLSWGADFLARKTRLPRVAGVIASATLLVLVTAGVLALLAMPVLTQGRELLDRVPGALDDAQERLEEFGQRYPFLAAYVPRRGPPPEADRVARNLLVTAGWAFEGLALALATFFLGVFLAMNPERYVEGAARLWPGGDVADRVRLLEKIGDALRSWLVSVGVLMAVMAASWTAGLWLVGIEYPVILGILGGVVEIVPYVGPMLGLLPPLFLAFGHGTGAVLGVVAIYIVIHILESYVLVPWVMHQREHLPPAITVGSLLVFGALFGTLGILLAVPLATVLYVVVAHQVEARAGDVPEERVPVRRAA